MKGKKKPAPITRVTSAKKVIRESRLREKGLRAQAPNRSTAERRVLKDRSDALAEVETILNA